MCPGAPSAPGTLPTICAIASAGPSAALNPALPEPTRRRLLAALALFTAGPVAAQFRVEIAGVGATQVPLVLGPLRDEAKAGLPLSQLIRADLERSGVFRSVAPDVALDERSTIDMGAWRAKGADALVAGSVTRLADGRFDVRYKLWNTVKGEQLLGQSKVVLAADLRLAAHRVADEIYEKLTGERGVFATRIAYVVRNGRRYTLHVTDADGEGGQVALSSAEPIISPAWSPDGKQLAYVSFETQKAVVWTQDLGSGERRIVASFRGSNSAPAWSPDGKRLAVTLSQDGLAQLYTMSVSGGAPERLRPAAARSTPNRSTHPTAAASISSATAAAARRSTGWRQAAAPSSA